LRNRGCGPNFLVAMMVKPAAIAPDDQHLVLSNLSPSPSQKRLALAVVLTLFSAFFITAGPLSTLQLPRIDAFVPAYATAMFVNDSITAVLLFAQFSLLRSRALLIIASGYLFTALILVPWMLTFPGVFTPGGLLGAGLQSTAWLYIVWHAGFPVFAMAYALLKDTDPSKQRYRSSRSAVILASIAVIAGICTATFLVIAGDALLPRLMLDTVQLSVAWQYAAAAAALLSVGALIVLWIRRRSVLDLWLMVVMCAYVIEICLISFPVPARYSIGWYAGRVYGVVSGSLVLLVLLYEITMLYGQLLRAVLAQRREREARLMTGDAVAATIAHEIKQPISAMVTNASAGVRWLDRQTPDLDEAKAAFRHIAADGHRAGEVITSIRAIFKRDTHNRVPLDLNELIREALTLAGRDLQQHGIAVRIKASKQLPHIVADRIQLQQVLLNLVNNATESRASSDGPRVLCVKSEVDGDSGVKVSVSDTGAGVASQDIDRIFNPLFSTKPDGMGMGLSICRSIVEAHNGRLWVAANGPRGAVFQFTLGSPAASPAIMSLA
jgi:signal transduction histidine kinase